nr:Smr/MutS family protein [Armatimonadota bacterium]
AAADAQEAVREARDQARLLLADLRARAERGTGTHEALEGLGAMDRQLSEVRQKIQHRPASLTPVHFKPVVGTSVNVVRFGQRGMVVEEGPGDEVMVAVGSLKMRLAPSELEPASAPHPGPARAPAHQLRMQKAEAVPQELRLLGMRAEEAVSVLDKYLDDALLAGMPTVRIIHGKGTGALKAAVWGWLKGHHAIQSYRIGGDGEGGSGATIVELVKE